MRIYKIIAVIIFCVYCSACSQLNAAPSEHDFYLGVLYLQQQRYVLACDKLYKSSRFLRIPKVFYSLAYCEEQLDKNNNAEKYYRIALQLSPHDPAALNNYGAFLCRQKRYKSGIHYLQQATKHSHYRNRSNSYRNIMICKKLANSMIRT